MRSRVASLSFLGVMLLVSVGCEERPSIVTLPTAPKPPGPGTISETPPVPPGFPGGGTREPGYVPSDDELW